jgi:hypothetical protein
MASGRRGAGFEASADATGSRASAARRCRRRVVLFPRFGSLCTSCASRSCTGMCTETAWVRLAGDEIKPNQELLRLVAPAVGPQSRPQSVTSVSKYVLKTQVCLVRGRNDSMSYLVAPCHTQCHFIGEWFGGSRLAEDGCRTRSHRR